MSEKTSKKVKTGDQTSRGKHQKKSSGIESLGLKSILFHDGDNDETGLYKLHLLILLLFICLGFLIYSNTFNSPFLFDDTNITENPYIRVSKLTWRGLIDSCTNLSGNRPIAMLSFTIDYYFHHYDVMGYHLVNIIIHILNGILLYFFIYATLGIMGYRKSNLRYTIKQGPPASLNPTIISFFAALIWFVHPIQINSVTYIVQRMNSMAVMFYLLSFLLYIKGRLGKQQRLSNPQSEKGSRLKTPRVSRLRTSQGSNGNPRLSKRYHYLWFTASTLAWLLALGCKETAATLPFFIFLYEWYFFQDLSRDWLRRNLRYFLGIFILFGLIALLYLGSNPSERITTLRDYANNEFTMTERLFTQFRVVIYYLSLLFYPHPSRLNFDYDFPLSQSLIVPATTILSLGLIIGLVGLAFFMMKKERLLSFCIFWFFGNLIIESSIIPLAIIFEHRAYLPSMLVFLTVVLIACRYIKQKWFTAGLLCMVVILFSIWTYQRNDVWKDAISLWSDNVKKSENKARPRNNLGNALFRQGRLEDSIIQYRESLRINPEYPNAHNNLGLALASQGNLTEAMRHFSEALRIKADYAKAHYNLGIALVNNGMMEEAINHFSEALRINPDYTHAHYSLGVLLGRKGNLDGAIRHFSEAIRIDPGYAQAHFALGLALSNQGNLKEAINHFSEALRIDPGHTRARMKRESVLKQIRESGR